MSKVPGHYTLVLLLITAAGSLVHARAETPGRRRDQERLKAYGKLVGEWKGTGQVQRASAKGAWRESAAWAWKLSNESAALELKVEDGKYLKSALLEPGEESGTFVLKATLADGSERVFRGTPGERDVLPLNAEGDGDGLRRITLTPLHDTRLLMLLEGQGAGDVLKRLGEVGYTRQGVAFASGDSYPVCIVTEGRGTIAVKHKGKTYWVCCTGCKELFEDDPEAVLAEAEERAKAKDK